MGVSVRTALSCLYIVFFMSSAAAQCVNSAKLSCDVYPSCFEKYCPCESTSDGYFLRYGKKYCDRFLASDKWSEKGKAWRDATLLCLQERIVPRLNISPNPSCDCKVMKDFAFQTHVDCYTQASASVCSLEFSDYQIIYRIIDVQDDLMSDPFGRKQLRDVLTICANDPNSTLPKASLDLIRKALTLLR
jgi:hypothetical protein